jgi:phosphate transport system permease protein
MSNLVLVLILLAVVGLAFQLGMRSGRGHHVNGVRMHSRPVYHGALVALWCAVPAFIVLSAWMLFERPLVESLALANVPDAAVATEQLRLVLLRRIEALASGFGVTGHVAAYEVAAAERLSQLRGIAGLAKVVVVLALAIIGLLFARSRLKPQLRARNQVERVVSWLLAMCSGIAILTTLGIVASMVGEALHFFSFVSPLDFFFGTVWNPGFSSTGGSMGEYGLLPLLWGTIMISVIALMVAVPVGLMTAIYLAEYADPRTRAIVKPTIEVLAGIPTIVYGVFAMMVIGPVFSLLGSLFGIDIRATSALTAGVVMGVMIIPFVSSLSDDIITQVPRSMRDGSLGLGATKSETIRQVVLPAALPGIIGAFLLAASRAIGETMIVVLAAGNNPVLHANPFEAVSTVTVSIVNSLTGDTDFASPQSLVAFALGITLFAITLAMNVVALYIVRRYREQYE